MKYRKKKGFNKMNKASVSELWDNFKMSNTHVIEESRSRSRGHRRTEKNISRNNGLNFHKFENYSDPRSSRNLKQNRVYIDI